MKIHGTLLTLAPSLNYKRENGYCHGFALRWLEALLVNESSVFEERIKRIMEKGPVTLKEEIVAVNKKLKQGTLISEEEQKTFEIQAFLDSLALLHDPAAYRQMFQEPAQQSDFDKISTLVSSDAIIRLGGLAKVNLGPRVANKEGISVFLRDILSYAQPLKKQGVPQLGFTLNTSGEHAMALFLDLGTNTWQVMDINQWPPTTTTNVDEVTEIIHKGLAESGSVCFDTNIVTTKQVFDLIEGPLQRIKEQLKFAIHSEDLERLLKTNLLFSAAIMGNCEVIEELAKAGANLNEPPYRGTLNPFHLTKTIASIAARGGFSDVIRVISHYGADLNAPILGHTPFHIALENNQLEVIRALAECGANINLGRQWDNKPPVSIAIQNRNIEAVELLLSLGADLDETALETAVQGGNVDIIGVLRKFDVDLNVPSAETGDTPAHMAASDENINVIKELAKAKVNFLTPNKKGKTALDIAQYYDCHEIVAFINEHLASLQELAGPAEGKSVEDVSVLASQSLFKKDRSKNNNGEPTDTPKEGTGFVS